MTEVGYIDLSHFLCIATFEEAPPVADEDLEEFGPYLQHGNLLAVYFAVFGKSLIRLLYLPEIAGYILGDSPANNLFRRVPELALCWIIVHLIYYNLVTTSCCYYLGRISLKPKEQEITC